MIKHITLMIGVFLCFSAYAQYDIAVEVDGLTCEDELLLANHFGDKQYLKDTSECINGVFHFRGDDKLENGVYLVVLPSKNWIEIIVSENEDQTKYVFKTDTLLKANELVIKGSKENEIFSTFNRYAKTQGAIAGEIKKGLDAEENDKKKEKIRQQLIDLTNDVNAERKRLADENQGTFVSKLYEAMREIENPGAPEGMEDEDEIKKYEYLWIRDHFWDNVDLSEDGLVRSPVFHSKLKRYFDRYMPPMADTAIMLGDTLINRIERAGSMEQYKYTIHFLLGYFEKAKYMCFDKAVWHMAKNYYCAGKAYWADSAYVAKMCEESGKMEPTLCEKVAPDMNMPDSTFGRRIRMSQIQKPVTVVVFWDIDCGHCKKEMPIISQLYDSLGNEHIEIYAVYTKGDWEGWKKRIAKEDFKFINVANAFGEDDYRKDYNIISTPQIYVLDKDKVIRFKKIGAKDIAATVQFLLEEQGIVEKAKDEEFDDDGKPAID